MWRGRWRAGRRGQNGQLVGQPRVDEGGGAGRVVDEEHLEKKLQIFECCKNAKSNFILWKNTFRHKALYKSH